MDLAETPEGLWVETVGTKFKVTRAWRNDKGETNVDKTKLVGVISAVLLVAVSEGCVRTGSGVAEEARVAAGGNTVVGLAEARPSPTTDKFPVLEAASLVFVGKVRSADFRSAPTGTPERVYSRTVEYEVVEVIKGPQQASMPIQVHVHKDRSYVVATKHGDYQLDPEFFKEGTLHIVVGVTEKPNYTWAQNLALRTDEAVAALKALTGIAWGQAVNGFQAGLVTKQAGFEAGRAMAFTVCLKNLEEKDLRLGAAGSTFGWKFLFTPAKKGDVPRYNNYFAPDTPKPIPVSLAARETKSLDLAIVENVWVFADARGWLYPQRIIEGKPAVKTLPVGKYTVTAIYEHLAHQQSEPCPYWHGNVVTGPVEIEVVEPAQAK